MVEITLNGERQEFAHASTIADLVDSLSMPERRLAVELNGSVIRKTAWKETKIEQDDRIEIVHFVGGG